MRKTIFIAILMIFTMGATSSFAENTDVKTKAPVTTEKKLATEEVNRSNNRIKEIRSMDKSKMTSAERRELRKEVKENKENVRKNGGVIVISGGTLLLIILLIILL